MRTRTPVPLLAGLVLAVAGCQPPGPLTDADLAAIGDTRQAFVDAVLAGDAAAVAAAYTEDGVEMPPNMPAVNGRAAIEARYRTQGPATTFTVTPLATEGYGDLAFDRGTFTFAASTEGMSEPVTDTGKYLVLCERQPDGSWLMTAAIWNSDLPASAPPAMD